jgi:hypothetical protein
MSFRKTVIVTAAVLVGAVAIVLSAPALAGEDKGQAVLCEGAVLAAHTLIVGKCSFTGSPAKPVFAKCKEDDVCRVKAYAWENEDGIFIIDAVVSVQKLR